MKIAVINEVSTATKNKDILSALRPWSTEHEIYNLGMSAAEGEKELTYINTAFMSGLLLETGQIDLIIGGCGTGQGYLNAVLKYPHVVAGLVLDTLDAWLFRQINDGNCLSLALNKGYGWAGDINLAYIFSKFLDSPGGQGYPSARSSSQQNSRNLLSTVDRAVHRSWSDILSSLDEAVLLPSFKHPDFADFIRRYLNNPGLKTVLMERGVI